LEYDQFGRLAVRSNVGSRPTGNGKPFYIQKAEENMKEHGNLKELLYQGFEYISKLIIGKIGKTDRSKDAKLGMIDRTYLLFIKKLGNCWS
jgi:hypothetical protein